MFWFAREFRIPSLRVNLKLGTLHIQGGDERLLPAFYDADSATKMICPICGGARETQQGATLQFCTACQATGAAESSIEWIEKIDATLLGTAAVSLSDINSFSFPSYFTAVSQYAATGEGVSVSVLMAYARDAEDLRQKVNDHIEDYFASRADFYPSLVIPDEITELLPGKSKAFADSPDSIGGLLHLLLQIPPQPILTPTPIE